MIPGYETQSISEAAGAPRTALIEACGLPEIGSELSGLAVRIGHDLERPFLISKSTIVVDELTADNLWESAFALREAIELLAIGGDQPRWAHRLIAHATAAIYGETLLRHVHDMNRVDRVSKAHMGQRLLAGHDEESALQEIAIFLAARDSLEPAPIGEIRAARRALPVAHPTEVLLTMGGDHRQMVDWDSVTNSYGLSPRPVPWRTQFSSCTASSPSPRAFAAARQLRHHLVGSAIDDVLDDTVENLEERTRQSLLTAFGVGGDDIDVVLTPSGTDAEFVALSMVLGLGEPLTTIILAPTEIGSGSVHAASGKHFSQYTPLGGRAQVGTELEGFDEVEINRILIDFRDMYGEMRAADAVEADLENVLEETEGRFLLHVVEGSKTGIRLPRLEAVRRWQNKFDNSMSVVVDAAQVRVDQGTITTHLSEGRMVFVSGSKFFGGPPFSGAVLIPRSVSDNAPERVAPGLSDYISRFDVPSRLQGLWAAANPRPNLGLVLRWAAATAEMTSFLNASPQIRDEILRRLARGVREIIDSAEHLQLVESPYTAFPSHDDRGLDDLPTIFSFLVLDGEGTPIDMDKARLVHRLMVTDLNEDITVEPGLRQLARQPFHLGQPVAISHLDSPDLGALRIAIGAPTLSQIVFDVSRGLNWVDRLELEIADIQAAIEKISLVLDSFGS